MNKRATRKNLYFAYGSNLSTAQMRYRCPGAKVRQTARLEHYKLAFGGNSSYRKGGAATILSRQNGQSVEGLLYTMTPDDWDKLDKWEAFPRKYCRFEVVVIDGEGQSITATTYQMNAFYPNSPSEEYFRIIEEGYAVHGLNPDNLISALYLSKSPGNATPESHREA